jgi:hypothetical protein
MTNAAASVRARLLKNLLKIKGRELEAVKIGPVER